MVLFLSHQAVLHTNRGAHFGYVELVQVDKRVWSQSGPDTSVLESLVIARQRRIRAFDTSCNTSAG